MAKVSEEELNRVLLPIQVGDPIPDVCCSCGEHSTRRVTVTIYRDGTSEINATRKFLWQFLIDVLLRVVSRRSLYQSLASTDDSIRVGEVGVDLRMTQCRRCARASDIEAHSAEFFEGQFQFIVHREYSRQFYQCQLLDEGQ